MTRRDLFASLTGSLASAGIPAKVEAVEAEPRPIAFKVTWSNPLMDVGMDDVERIRAKLKTAFEKTEWANVPVLILTPGMDFQAVTATDETTAKMQAALLEQMIEANVMLREIASM